MTIKEIEALCAELRSELENEDKEIAMFKKLLSVFKNQKPKIPFGFRDENPNMVETATKRVMTKLTGKSKLTADDYVKINKLRSWYNEEEL
jgi:hypothetical protein